MGPKETNPIGAVSEEKTIVAHNGPNDIFTQKRSTTPKRSSSIRFGYVGRAYPHKYIQFFGPFSRELFKQFGINASLVVTLQEDEYETLISQTAGFGCQIETVGSLSLDRVPEFIEGIDCLFLPSLMECFSVSPLEGLMCSRISLCADREHFGKYLEPMQFMSIQIVPAELRDNFIKKLNFALIPIT